MKLRRTFVAIPAGAMLMAAVAAAPAMADNMLDVSRQATLIAKGVAVDVPLTYTCPTPTSEYPWNNLNVQLRQVARAQQVAASGTDLSPVCDGTPQTMTVRLTVEGGTAPFKPGTALLNATLYTSDDGMVVQVSQEVRLVR